MSHAVATMEVPKTANGFPFDSLEALRKKLLNLTSRNRLLNYRYPKTACVRIIDELPDQVATEIKSGKSFTFLPVAEPTDLQLVEAGFRDIDPKTGVPKTEKPNAEQWANKLGFATSYELPTHDNSSERAAKHCDTNLQTLLYAQNLEARLRIIRGRAERALEETGANVLYLVLGFLEWFESPDSDTPRLAPLFTLPVRLSRASLNRQNGTYRYQIFVSDDGLLTNVTLQEKLERDFGLHLPDIDEETLPEDYFETIQQTVLKQQTRWKIRRHASLVLLDFAKQVMYEDLDPDNWPTDGSFENHPLIERFFGAADDLAVPSTGHSADYPIDRVKDVHDKFPLVFEADSSQHSAMIDAVRGENLVIQGPPGTGKSQTIANIIAACIANGQKVLFVSEKMAALNVVKDRLDRVGLGDFCLELHSHKTNKQRILNDLKLRIENQDSYRKPETIDADIQRFEHLKKQLREYAELVNSQWRNTNLTIHQILNGATRLREELQINPDDLVIDNIDGESCTHLKQQDLVDHASMLATIVDQVAQQAKNGLIANHFWHGVNNAQLDVLQSTTLQQLLYKWNDKLVALQNQWRESCDSLNLDYDSSAKLGLVDSYVTSVGQLPELSGLEPLPKLRTIVEQCEEFQKLLENYHQIHALLNGLATVINLKTIKAGFAKQTLANSLNYLETIGVTNDKCIATLLEHFTETKQAVIKAQQIRSQFAAMIPHVPESLHRALRVSAEGLSEFLKLSKLISQLPAESWSFRTPAFDDPNIDHVLDELSLRLGKIIPLHHQLKSRFVMSNLPSSIELRDAYHTLKRGGVFRWCSRKWRDARRKLLSHAFDPKSKLDELLNRLPILIEFVEGRESLERFKHDSPLAEQLCFGIDTPLDRYQSLRHWYKSVRSEYGVGFGSRVAIGTALLELDQKLALGISTAAENTISPLISDVISALANAKNIFPNCEAIRDADATLCDRESPIVNLLATLGSQLKHLSSVIHDQQAPISKLLGVHNHLDQLHQRVGWWQNSALVGELKTTELNLSIEPNRYAPNVFNALQRTLVLAKVVQSNPGLLAAIEASPSLDGYRRIKQSEPILRDLLAEIRDLKTRFVETGKVNLEEWTELCDDQVADLVTRNESALANPKWLNTWLEYIRVRKKLLSNGLSKIIAGIEDKRIAPTELKDVVRSVMFHQLANDVMAHNPSLAMFSGLEQMAIREQFQAYDKKLLSLQREKIAFAASRAVPPQGNNRGPVGTYTETTLIQHHAGLKRPRIAVRTLIRQASNAIQALKPCFMMSPMSVAQYLEPGEHHFDLVIMDEASQIRPEEALGAVARGRSLVVVGDPKQLPPTSFFERTNDDSDDDDAVALQVSESILDSVMPIFRNRQLQWHYRSRHESLIAFSNKHFYNSKLVIFPSPFQQTDDYGIRFTQVEQGQFTNRRNVEEARAVVTAIANHVKNKPFESIGAVAMNGEQRDEIIVQLEQLAKTDDEFREARDRNDQSTEPLFVKNLENVQGDERDVIVISMTYGPEKPGAASMYQRFGPINGAGGWRRLNVLFTRSKKCMHIFSSMNSGHIKIGPNTSRGVQALRAWLEYCENGHLHNTEHTGKEPDSDFEIAVINALEQHGFECEPQLGVAGYFLDVAVRDPKLPGRFLMGIECDGATYHSAKSTRDRDRLRQEILESLGWKIRRIWSTDWFKHPDAQIQPILLELQHLMSQGPTVSDRREKEFIDTSNCDSDQQLLFPIKAAA